MLRTFVRGAVAVVLTASAYVALPVAPVSAAACSTEHGVTVVVDFHELGGGVQSVCVADGGGETAAALFPDAGYALSYVQRQPGFVCRVADRPASEPCVNTPPADAYWALFWSDGESGSWTYASIGAGGLRIPDGGYVAFSWNGSSTRSMPGFSPAPHPTATPTPSPTHSAHPSAHPSSHQPNGPSATPTTGTSANPSESPSESTKPKGDKAKPSKQPTASATSAEPSEQPTSSSADALPDSTEPTSAEPTDPDDGGLPSWVAPVVIVVLFGAAGAVAVVRRRRGGSAA